MCSRSRSRAPPPPGKVRRSSPPVRPRSPAQLPAKPTAVCVSSWRHHGGLRVERALRQLKIGVADLEAVDGLPVIALGAAAGLLDAEQVGDGGQPGVVAVLAD